ncbi:siderophore-interacting protein [Arsenicicoccus cauae]|nr:siderophore-interacting protein [Arsenicicoccus cauae]
MVQYGVLERTTAAAYAAAYATTTAMPPRRAFYPQLEAQVTALQQLSPAFRRVTITAGGLADLTLTGPDEYLGLFLPQPAGNLHLPANMLNPRTALAAMPEPLRPDLRWYTIRAHRPERAEIDVDIVCTGHDGPGSRWIRSVCVGDEVGLRIQAAPYGSAPPTGHHLLLADETGLPGQLAILDAYADDPGRRFTAVVEVPTEGFLHDEVREAGVHVVYRGEGEPGSAMLPALRACGIADVDYAWACAEAATVAAVRRHLVRERDVPRRRVMASGFWKVGQARL